MHACIYGMHVRHAASPELPSTYLFSNIDVAPDFTNAVGVSFTAGSARGYTFTVANYTSYGAPIQPFVISIIRIYAKSTSGLGCLLGCNRFVSVNLEDLSSGLAPRQVANITMKQNAAGSFAGMDIMLAGAYPRLVVFPGVMYRLSLTTNSTDLVWTSMNG